jgi:hypothetical protein
VFLNVVNRDSVICAYYFQSMERLIRNITFLGWTEVPIYRACSGGFVAAMIWDNLDTGPE